MFLGLNLTGRRGFNTRRDRTKRQDSMSEIDFVITKHKSIGKTLGGYTHFVVAQFAYY